MQGKSQMSQKKKLIMRKKTYNIILCLTLLQFFLFENIFGQKKSTIKISGFIDTYYSFNFDRPKSRINQLRNFDIHDNQFSLNLADLIITKSANPLGFSLWLGFGPTMDIVHTIDGRIDSTFRNIHQAYATIFIPIGNKFKIDIGKMVTHQGAEVIETNGNWTYSRSLLFAWAIPYYHTGIRLTYPVFKSLTVMGMIANGWNNVIDNNDLKTFCAQIILTPPIKDMNIYLNWIGGPELKKNDKDWRIVWDGIFVWQILKSLAINFNYDYGYERKATWMGFSGMIRYTLNKEIAFIVRGEYFDDKKGNQTATKQKLYEVTLTGERRVSKNLLVRTEFRRDQSDKKIFNSKKKKDQNTILMGTILEF
jgi:hypothetical protein